MAKKKSLPEKVRSLSIRPQLVEDIRVILQSAQNHAARAVNSAMVYAYWEIGRRIVEEEQQGDSKAAYGKYLLEQLAKAISRELGKNLDSRELRRMRQLYLYYPTTESIRPELSWTHYRLLLRIENKNARDFYVRESIS